MSPQLRQHNTKLGVLKKNSGVRAILYATNMMKSMPSDDSHSNFLNGGGTQKLE